MPASVNLLFDDYKLKLEYLTGQFDRLWTRFNFFLGVQLAVFGSLGYVTFTLKNPVATPLPIAVGIVVSGLWYIVSAQDRALVEIYRERAETAAEVFAKHPDGISDYQKVHPVAKVETQWRAFNSWYASPISVTRLPALMALALFAVWFALLFSWPAIASRLIG